jgi:hypothetical protein
VTTPTGVGAPPPSGTPTATPTPPLPELRLRLPGAWWQIPLTDHGAARAAVRELVTSRLAGDELAKVRIAAERRFLGGLEQAIAGDGLALHVALTIVPGIPIPISALVLQPAQQLTPAIGTSPEATMRVLAAGLERHGEIHRFATAESEVARRVRRAPMSPQVEGADDVDQLTVEYFLTVPGTKRFLLVVFSAPLGELRDVLVDLFDSIVRVSYWHRPAE